MSTQSSTKHYLRTLSWRFHDTATLYPNLPKEKIFIHSPEDLFKNFHSLFKGHVRERFVIFWLSSSNRINGFEIITEGILNSALVHAREVFRGAIVATCASIMLAHNHPSGNPEPSSEDVQITRQLVEASKIIGIPISEHMIFTDDSYMSFAERGLI
jgi:DNA repair protein RadC